VTAAPVDLVIEQGSTFKKRLQLSLGATVEQGGTPVNLNGYGFSMQVRAKENSATALLSMTSPDNIQITDAVNGWIRIYLSKTATAGLTWSQAVYDLEMTEPGGDVRRVLYGKVRVDKEITKISPDDVIIPPPDDDT